MEGFSISLQTNKKSKLNTKSKVKKKKNVKKSQGTDLFGTSHSNDDRHSTTSTQVIKLTHVDNEAEELEHAKKERAKKMIIVPGNVTKISDILNDSNEESLEADLTSLPNVPHEDQYIDVPVEEFGKALLRGMGWNSDEENEKEKRERLQRKKKQRLPHELQSHPDGLGIGAKPISSTTDKNKKNDSKSRTQERQMFMPIIKIDKLTGKPILDENKKLDFIHSYYTY
ncbi:spliceosome ATPase-activating subunit SPP2 NDAI_0C01280 [Naumovozyma dairenensis CBS 421]|uniref:Pre-mRNA-splicing factor n=1 Tax=Naumovozyma dairenensis (strain ATCC 10597 / BCRC 20456 / CBS 421 / NBRC 0211 / NRRL Y-12639) TaxID=1071378 RepID=G0W7M8_NAUDC|nr:hypothetical protein NDAI_0C01280 [Naumovozyma dairenensis CBS 421]CCD23789.1 hypothetical protein NDAI_0C01280 [Naumovozyma dairenensis CBS 421]